MRIRNLITGFPQHKFAKTQKHLNKPNIRLRLGVIFV